MAWILVAACSSDSASGSAASGSGSGSAASGSGSGSGSAAAAAFCFCSLLHFSCCVLVLPTTRALSPNVLADPGKQRAMDAQALRHLNVKVVGRLGSRLNVRVVAVVVILVGVEHVDRVREVEFLLGLAS